MSDPRYVRPYRSKTFHMIGASVTEHGFGYPTTLCGVVLRRRYYGPVETLQGRPDCTRCFDLWEATDGA